MNANTTKLLSLGLSLLAAAACSAEASSPPPNGSGNGNNNNAGQAGTLNTGNPPVQGTGGTGTGTAGSSNTGTAGTSTGTAGTAPVGTAGTTGAGGGGALAACPSPPAAGMIGDTLIDDMEDMDNGVARVGGRSGFWYTYLDTYGSTIMPTPDSTGAAPLKPGTTDCHGGTACIIVAGTTSAADEVAMVYPYAGVGFDFSNAKKPCAYNGSAYSGIKFWARGDAQIRIKINVAATADAGGGGTCTTMCNDAFGQDVILTPTWGEVDVPFAGLLQEGWGTVATFDKTSLLSVQIQFPAGATFSAAFDDFVFY